MPKRRSDGSSLPLRLWSREVPVSETDKKIKEYEKEGKWSHAAELADKEAEKTKREDLKTRALENYKKAGYNFDKYDT